MSAARWRAPQEEGATLVVPDWQQLPALLHENQRWVEQSPLHWSDRPLADLRALALSSAMDEASRWHQKPVDLHRPLIVTGHQPELFHPGVLAKNIAISELAGRTKGSSLNIHVDADVAKSTSLKLPSINETKGENAVSFSHVPGPLPYEEWTCDDEMLFSQFPAAISEQTGAWPWQPVLKVFWQEATRHSANRLIPERWILARSAWERQQGLHNHELTMSRWCQTPFFHWLLGQFIAEHARFAAIYNDELHRYRKEHRIRSANHPVADLLITGDLIELPFWAWPEGALQRGRLCARTQQGQATLIAILNGKEQLLPDSQNSGLSSQHLQGWKIRPKALITSMMFRLFLADLFVHGIGGAIYDELTDRIFARFWNTALPRFAIVTATLRLPWDFTPVEANSPVDLKCSLRDLEWNPDRHLQQPLAPTTLQLQQRKQELIVQNTLPEALHRKHVELEAIRKQLQPIVEPQEMALQAKLHDTLLRLKQEEHLFSREHPWVFYPAEMLEKLVASFRK